MLHEVRVEPGQEVMETLTQQIQTLGIERGAIVSLIGAVDSCEISNMPRSDAGRDLLTEYYEPMELSGTGEIRDGKPHIHCVLGREGDAALCGHLHWARVQTWYVSAYVIALE